MSVPVRTREECGVYRTDVVADALDEDTLLIVLRDQRWTAKVTAVVMMTRSQPASRCIQSLIQRLQAPALVLQESTDVRPARFLASRLHTIRPSRLSRDDTHFLQLPVLLMTSEQYPRIVLAGPLEQ